jgi:hypothetical protein
MPIRVMTEIIKRIQHCSYCDEVGHAINNCQDPQIDILLQQFYEYISLDIKCNFKMKYVKYNMSLFNLSEIKIVGYQCGISMNKQSREMFTNELLREYYNAHDYKYHSIVTSMNESELAYFAKNISESSKSWNSRKISLKRVQSMLGITNKSKPTRNKKVSTKSSNNSSCPADISTAVSVYDNNNNENNKNNDSFDNVDNYEIQFFMLPVLTPEMLNDLSPFIQKSIQYIYGFVVVLFLLNFYMLHMRMDNFTISNSYHNPNML